MATGKYQEWLEPDNLIKLEAWARDGLTDEQIASKIGVSTSTFYKWKNDFAEFSESLKKGKEVVDIQVENALLKRALGYRYIETTRELITNKETGDTELVVTKTVEKEVQPDVTAQIYWLKNRRPEQWRDRREVELEGNAGVTIINDIPKPSTSKTN